MHAAFTDKVVYSQILKCCFLNVALKLRIAILVLKLRLLLLEVLYFNQSHRAV